MQAKDRALRRLRAIAAIAVLASAACAEEAASGKPERTGTPRPAQHATQASIDIVPLEPARSADAAVFSAYLAQETARGGELPLAIGGALGAGDAGNGTYLVAVIDIADETGHPLHRLVSEETLATGDIDERALRRFAAATASRITQWYAAWSPAPSPTMAERRAANDSIVTAGIAGPDKLAFAISVGPAPGDGAGALTRALDAQLKERAESTPWLDAQSFSIEGRITTSSRNDGRTDVSIHWLVKSAEGARLGEIHQKNALDAARIASRWGDVAETAARAAADGVIAVLQPAPDRIAANG